MRYYILSHLTTFPVPLEKLSSPKTMSVANVMIPALTSKRVPTFKNEN